MKGDVHGRQVVWARARPGTTQVTEAAEPVWVVRPRRLWRYSTCSSSAPRVRVVLPRNDGMCDNEPMGSTSEQNERTSEADGRAASDQAEGSQRATIRMLLRQTPEERLRGLVNATRFFANAHRS